MTRTYYKGVAGALLVFDLTRPETYKSIGTWINEMKEHGNENVCLLLVGNKSDMIDDRQVSAEVVEEFATEHDMRYIEVSALTGENVVKAFEGLAVDIFERVQKGKIDIGKNDCGVRKGNGISSLCLNKEKESKKCC